MMGSGIVLYFKALPDRYLVVWCFTSLNRFLYCRYQPILSAAVTSIPTQALEVECLGMTTTAQQFGSMVGPVFASIVSTYVGISYVFSITGLLLLYMAFQSRKLSAKNE